jgi:hypothetical protein
MTPERLQYCLDVLRISQSGLGPILGCHPSLTKRWAMGTARIPTPVAVWLEACVAIRRREPKPPKDWRVLPTPAPPASRRQPRVRMTNKRKTNG